MSVTLEKPVCLPEDYALKLKRLAVTLAVTENSLLQSALDLLFQRPVEADALRDWEYFEAREAERHPLPPRPAARVINPAEFIITHEVRIDPEKIIRRNGAKT